LANFDAIALIKPHEMSRDRPQSLGKMEILFYRWKGELDYQIPTATATINIK
jgi:hypothetical protein